MIHQISKVQLKIILITDAFVHLKKKKPISLGKVRKYFKVPICFNVQVF